MFVPAFAVHFFDGNGMQKGVVKYSEARFGVLAAVQNNQSSIFFKQGFYMQEDLVTCFKTAIRKQNFNGIA